MKTTTIQERRCSQCGRRMRLVASINPMHGSNGLLAFLCAWCGSTETALFSANGESGDANTIRPPMMPNLAG